MKKEWNLWQLLGFGVTSLLGTLLHYVYEWTGESLSAAPFSGVNESTWEHMKLLFFPMFLFAIVQSAFVGKEHRGFWCVKLRGTLLGLFLIPALYYTINGAFGHSPDWINIAIFFVSAAIAYFVEARMLWREELPCKRPKLSLAVLFALAVLFVVFTFLTPQIPLFQDPLTGSYGIP